MEEPGYASDSDRQTPTSNVTAIKDGHDTDSQGLLAENVDPHASYLGPNANIFPEHLAGYSFAKRKAIEDVMNGLTRVVANTQPESAASHTEDPTLTQSEHNYAVRTVCSGNVLSSKGYVPVRNATPQLMQSVQTQTASTSTGSSLNSSPVEPETSSKLTWICKRGSLADDESLPPSYVSPMKKFHGLCWHCYGCAISEDHLKKYLWDFDRHTHFSLNMAHLKRIRNYNSQFAPLDSDPSKIDYPSVNGHGLCTCCYFDVDKSLILPPITFQDEKDPDAEDEEEEEEGEEIIDNLVGKEDEAENETKSSSEEETVEVSIRRKSKDADANPETVQSLTTSSKEAQQILAGNQGTSKSSGKESQKGNTIIEAVAGPQKSNVASSSTHSAILNPGSASNVKQEEVEMKSPERDFRCCFCPNPFKTLEVLKNHLRMHHVPLTGGAKMLRNNKNYEHGLCYYKDCEFKDCRQDKMAKHLQLKHRATPAARTKGRKANKKPEVLKAKSGTLSGIKMNFEKKKALAATDYPVASRSKVASPTKGKRLGGRSKNAARIILSENESSTQADGEDDTE